LLLPADCLPAVCLFSILACLAWRPGFTAGMSALGALLGITARWSLWRMGRQDKSGDACTGCGQCDHHCEGACAPADRIHWAECVLCYNCKDDCPEQILGYAVLHLLPRGEIAGPDLNRRAVITPGLPVRSCCPWPAWVILWVWDGGPTWYDRPEH
jgi:hypothetical protein